MCVVCITSHSDTSRNFVLTGNLLVPREMSGHKTTEVIKMASIRC